MARSTQMLVLGIATAAIWAPPARAGMAFTATVSPTIVRSPARLTYALRMTNDGDTVQTFSVGLQAPFYGPPPGNDAPVEAQSVQRLGAPTIVGSATMTGGSRGSAAVLPACSVIAGVGGHGYGVEGVGFDVQVPPRSTSTLRVRYRAGLALWTNLDLRLRFRVGAILVSGRRGTLPRSRTIATPQPRIVGRVAMHLTFRTRPRSGSSYQRASPAVALGRAILVTGRTYPAAPGQVVELHYAQLGHKRPVLARGRAMRLRAGAGGRFRGSWIPPRFGRYELWATYHSQRAKLLSDDTCPRLIRVRRP